jgi:hypothetical protein
VRQLNPAALCPCLSEYHPSSTCVHRKDDSVPETIQHHPFNAGVLALYLVCALVASLVAGFVTLQATHNSYRAWLAGWGTFAGTLWLAFAIGNQV